MFLFFNRIILVDEQKFCGTPITPAATPAPPTGAAHNLHRRESAADKGNMSWNMLNLRRSKGRIGQMATPCRDVLEQRIEVIQI